MTNRSQILLSQLTPPAARSDVLDRARVTRVLGQALHNPLTLLIAETGYGKSTSILAFIHTLQIPVFWYSVTPPDRDPALFLANLFTAFNQRGFGLGQEALRILEQGEGEETDALVALLNAVVTQVKGPCLLVLDDFQPMGHSADVMRLTDWLVEHLPPNLHVIIASREELSFPSMARWRMKRRVLEIGREDLAFEMPEVDELFRSTYGMALDGRDLQQLYDRTEGWAIGLQAVWQSLIARPQSSLSQILGTDRDPKGDLFTYLAEEVLDKQEPEVQAFLTRTSVLSFLESDVCDFLLDKQNSLEVLTELYGKGLFIEQMRPGIFRYHHIFRQFLHDHLDEQPGLAKELHRKIASYFMAHEYWERAISHFLSAQDFMQVGKVLTDVGERMVQGGRYESLEYWVGELPEDVRQRYPYVNYLMGEVERYSGRFDQALEDYRAAQRRYQARNNDWGVSLALRGQAQVYLDTIRPVNATVLLNRALVMLDPLESPGEVAELLLQLAENQVNQGQPQEAMVNLKRARELAPGKKEDQDFVDARLMLRTGRIEEGIRLLEPMNSEVEDSRGVRPQRFHREATLLLSLFHAFKGEAEKSRQYAEKGLELGQTLRSGFVSSVGKMRLGHALQLGGERWLGGSLKRIQEYYEDSIREVDIVRIHVEPLWGLCRLFGFAGMLEEARQVGNEGLNIANSAGDTWIGVLIHLSLGASLALAGEYEAASQELSQAESMASAVLDDLSLTAAHLWQAYTANKQGYGNSAAVYVEQALESIAAHGYEFLLTKASILGSDDPVDLVPLLLLARRDGLYPELVDKLLKGHGVGEGVLYHPGYTLRLRTLGPLEVYLGRKQVEADAWKRGKSRQLLGLLAGAGQKGLTREQVGTMLWPEADAPTAANNFKVVLNALNQVLEPDRPSGEPAYFVARRGDSYLLNPEASLTLEQRLFEEEAHKNSTHGRARAFNLYRGRFLEGEPAQEWFTQEEAYFHRLYLEAADKLIAGALESGDWEQALAWCDALLRQDPLYEPAYGYQMRAYSAQGNLAMARQVYRQAQQALGRGYGGMSPALEQLAELLLD